MSQKSKYGNMPNRENLLAKVKGDAGVYRVHGIDWLNNKVLLDRAGYEWLPIAKVALEAYDEVANCTLLTQGQKEAFWELEALTGLPPIGIGDIAGSGATPSDVWNDNLQLIDGIRADATNILFPE